MKKIWLNIKNYFVSINYGALFNNTSEVLWLTLFAFLPLIINIVIHYLSVHNLSEAVKAKIIPGEILSYSLSFIAPSMYLLIKTNGSNYKLPLLKIFSLITFILYFCTAILLLIAKNRWVPGIDSNHHEFDLYFQLSLVFLLITILLRIYSTYHGNYSNWSKNRKEEQEEFNARITSRIG